MLFNSLQFLVFFMVVTLWFFRLRSTRGRRNLLLAASCYFYMSFIPWYLLILLAVIVIDYWAGIRIEKSSAGSRKAWLLLSLAANIGILCYFKYFNFFSENINLVLHAAGFGHSLPYLSYLLPVGLSFHTFQAMSYTIEVYRGRQPAERNFASYSLYVLFYPQLVAGPIERPQHILPQLHRFRSYNAVHVREDCAVWPGDFSKR